MKIKRNLIFYEIPRASVFKKFKLVRKDLEFYKKIDIIYRALCSILYNFAQSGHPGGSISSGRIVEILIFENMLYDLSNPERDENDVIVYAAGHKVLGMYALWAIRNELIRQANEKLLPEDLRYQIRLEDLLGFRRNPLNSTPLFKKYNSKALDGHPDPSMPFVKFTTGASGVGFANSIGYALALIDIYGEKSPKVNVIEGEGGMTAGRVLEAISSASTANLYNLIVHIDWNQASIDTERVCREKNLRGDYVEWSPDEFFYLSGWNVIKVKNGMDFSQIYKAQRIASRINNKKPTAIIYRTIKGFKYGLEGKASHGKGHKFCSNDYYNSLKEFEENFKIKFPRIENKEIDTEKIEKNYFESLMVIREVIKRNPLLAQEAGKKIKRLKEKLIKEKRVKIKELKIEKAFEFEKKIPEVLMFKERTEISLKEALGEVLKNINKETEGAFFAVSSDVFESTNVSMINEGFGEGFFNAVENKNSRLFSSGGICEDAMACISCGISSFGKHIGIASSYASFSTSTGHLGLKLYAMGQQARKKIFGKSYNTVIFLNSHSSLTTGEDGPTHSDPQGLQLFQDNFPKGTIINLTPWDPKEIYPLIKYSLSLKPAILSIFVTRPKNKIIEREKFDLPDLWAGIKGIYKFLCAEKNSKQYNGTIILQGSGVAIEFFKGVFEFIKKKGFNMNVYYITSKELFDFLEENEKEKILPEEIMYHSIGITEFTIATLYWCIRSNFGIKNSLYPFKNGYYCGSGKGEMVLKEAGLDLENQIKTIEKYAIDIEKRKIRI